MILQSKKEELLQNKINKQRFIHYLADKLERAGCSTDHAKQDADVLIVQADVGSARAKETVIIGDYTDLLILLLYHAEINTHDLFLASEPKQGSSKNKIWCIQQSKELIGIDVCNNFLFIHAILGCDTTVFHLAISNMAQRHVAFCERHVAFCERHVALYERHVALCVHHVALHVRHADLVIFRQ